MERLRDYLIYIGVSIFIGVWIFSIIYSFELGKDTPPLIEAKIPESTKDFFSKLARLGSEVNIDFIKRLTKRDYDNEKDYGKEKDNQLLTLEDENFIVYYHSSKKELIRAQSVIQYANRAVQPLKALFGTYYYPSLVQGRKLPIYLAASRQDYNEIGRGLGFEMMEWSAAVTCMIYDNQGKNVCRGIILSEKVYDNADNSLEKVLRHEMAHFDHFSAIDITQKTKVLNWECEGIASYFAKEDRPINRTKIKSIQLDEQLENYLDSYWVGSSVFQYAASNYGNRAVPKIIQGSLKQNITDITPEVFNISFSGFENGWKNYYLN